MRACIHSGFHETSMLCPTQKAVNMEHSLVKKEIGNLIGATALQIQHTSENFGFGFLSCAPTFCDPAPFGCSQYLNPGEREAAAALIISLAAPWPQRLKRILTFDTCIANLRSSDRDCSH